MNLRPAIDSLTRRGIVVSLAFSAFALYATQAKALLVGVSSIDDSVYSIDPLDGSATLITAVNSTGNINLTGATFLAGDYYISDVLFEDNDLLVGTVDLGTGDYTGISDQGPSIDWHGIASDEDAAIIYAMDIANEVFVSMTAGGVITTIGANDLSVRGMAYDDANDILYAVAIDGNLYTLDTSDGSETLIGSLGSSINMFEIGLAYDEVNDILYATSSSDQNLYTLNTSDGSAMLVGSTGAASIGGLAWIVPEPSSLALLHLGGLVLLGTGRRRK